MQKPKIGDLVEVRYGSKGNVETLRGRITREVHSQDRPRGLPDAFEVAFLDDDGQVLEVDAIEARQIRVVG